MSRKTIRTKVHNTKWVDYKKVAESFFGGADVAREYEYWNAAGVLIVHSAIAYADSISIKFRGEKSQGEDHNQTVILLKEILAVSDENKKAYIHLEKILAHKTTVSYSGDVYEANDIDLLWKHLERLKNWAEDLLGR
ncbi:MAG: hypothetical protein HXY50_03675 [Ignavibacteriaceae bacterium]|nr:hypothetical protein [Ignavibacteriaceae bacterium]